MKKILVISSLLLVAIIISCTTTEPIPVDENIRIAEIDAAVIETYLNVHVNNPSASKEVVVERNGQVVMNFTADKTDTAITDTGLTENTLYMYKAKLTEKGKVIGESSEVSVRTIQPTSHEFTWQTFAFGNAGAGSSSLYDVAIIDENNIWAVGEIYMKDSLGQIDPQAYNAVHWDGIKWKLLRVKVRDFGTLTGYFPLRAIWAFAENNIWFESNADLIKWDGNKFESRAFFMTSIPFNGQVNKIWGTNEDNIFCVGNGGAIYNFKGNSWQKIESGTDWDIYDVFGYTNSVNSQEEIICASTNPNNYTNSTILKITEKTKVGKINLTTGRLTGSAWTNKGFPIYTTGDGIFTNKSGKWEEIKLPVNYTTSKIRGNGLNDIFLCGVLGLITHYNGKEWKVYNDVYNAVYTSVHFNGNIAAFVGWRDGKGVITIGRRN